MLVTDRGQLIRTKVENIRITGRSAQGVRVFHVAEGENVVSVAWLVQEDEDGENGDESEAGAEQENGDEGIITEIHEAAPTELSEDEVSGEEPESE
jgi:Type IIA topoisomerase (DNA gyrase/topo II, topoisomerase IV), A subunit